MSGRGWFVIGALCAVLWGAGQLAIGQVAAPTNGIHNVSTENITGQLNVKGGVDAGTLNSAQDINAARNANIGNVIDAGSLVTALDISTKRNLFVANVIDAGSLVTTLDISSGRNVFVAGTVDAGSFYAATDVNAGRNANIANVIDAGSLVTALDISSQRNMFVAGAVDAGSFYAATDLNAGRNANIANVIDAGSLVTLLDISSQRNMFVANVIDAGSLVTALDISSKRNGFFAGTVDAGSFYATNATATCGVTMGVADERLCMEPTLVNFMHCDSAECDFSKLIAAANGVTVSTGSTTMTLSIKASASIDFPNISTLTCSTQTMAMTANQNDPVACSFPPGLENGLVGTCWVSASNVISFRLCNVTVGSIDPANGTFAARTIR